MHFTLDTTELNSDGVREQAFTLGEVPGVLWTPATPPETNPEVASATRPLILLAHGGGQHKKAPGIVARAHRYVRDLGAAVACVDVPGHGDRPQHPQFHRIATQNQERVDAGEPRLPLIAAFQNLVARQSVPEWRAVVDALQTLEHVGAGPLGYGGGSLGCGLGVPFVAAEPRVKAAVLGQGSALCSAKDAARITVPVEFLVQWDDEFISHEESLALYEAFGSTQKSMHVNPGGHGAVPRHEIDSSTAFYRRHLL